METDAALEERTASSGAVLDSSGEARLALLMLTYTHVLASKLSVARG